jgi:hypothetical protein
MDCQDLAVSRPLQCPMKRGCVLTGWVFAKTLQARPPCPLRRLTIESIGDGHQNSPMKWPICKRSRFDATPASRGNVSQEGQAVPDWMYRWKPIVSAI